MRPQGVLQHLETSIKVHSVTYNFVPLTSEMRSPRPWKPGG